jgi:predicted nucleic acid-binding protein
MSRSKGRQVSRTRNNGKAEIIVSGDSDLLALNPFRGIPIVTPATFLQREMR